MGATEGEYDLLEDQYYFVDEICRIISERKVDAVLLAGDVYDRSVASAAAIRLYDYAMNRICREFNTKVLTIAGNHDSAERLSSCGQLLEKAGLYISGAAEREPKVISFDDTEVFLLPWITEEKVRSLYPEERESIGSLTDAYHVVTSHMRDRFSPDKKHIVVSHAFIINSETSTSDRAAEIGFATQVSADVFDGFDYALQSSREDMLKQLEPVAPDWANAIRHRTGIHAECTLPDSMEDAWKWKQLQGIIEEITSMPFRDLQAKSLMLSARYRETTALYAEKCAWYHLLRRTEANIDMNQALQGWKLTVKRIGKGTGKTAPKLKAEARKLMSKCQTAVPAWIMPINKALESLNPKVNRFDIVIIDEASQSDISSLAILYMGRKLIIVGDDKQVSPMAVGVDVAKMDSLEQMYLRGKIPNAQLYNAKTSIYDIAATTFKPLMLHEHFRCVPEIIGFSNMLSYDYQIKPLRGASSSNLLPAVINYRVDAGQRDEKNKSNLPEAKAIVALMRACMEQPEYEGKTFGVISLLGDEQYQLIQKEIDASISPKEIMQRNILCGNSANFQGDERDVIFLSLVDSKDIDNPGPLHLQNYGVDDSTRKRYNVAVSRARDQLWVVHSLDAANDLKPGDIRKKLLDYAANPHALEIAHEKISAASESPFEKAVATALSDRGYHLVQQWEVGAYRLDMVAVCGGKTVAIECDGERWHSGDVKIREDMERQTILERLGWRFIRIRGSEYYRAPQQTIERVIRELAQYGIEPEDAETVVSDDRNTETQARGQHAESK
ncbi:MAG: exonuclease subunit SbcD [Clostridiales bacterium]|nr:exonuclease subunit SbcD [Clostridiales bacterium]